MTTATRFIRKQLAQLPKKYARISNTTAVGPERKPANINELSIIERQFLEFIETPTAAEFTK